MGIFEEMTDESNNPRFLYYDPYLAKAFTSLCISWVTYKCQLHCGIATYRIRHRKAQCCSAAASDITRTAPERRLGGNPSRAQRSPVKKQQKKNLAPACFYPFPGF